MTVPRKLLLPSAFMPPKVYRLLIAALEEANLKPGRDYMLETVHRFDSRLIDALKQEYALRWS
jgi:hypothetical protein